MAVRLTPQNFSQYQDQIRAQWPELTQEDVDHIANDRGRLVGKIQERYDGLTAQTAEQQLADFEGGLKADKGPNPAKQPQPGRDMAAAKPNQPGPGASGTSGVGPTTKTTTSGPGPAGRGTSDAGGPGISRGGTSGTGPSR